MDFIVYWFWKFYKEEIKLRIIPPDHYWWLFIYYKIMAYFTFFISCLNAYEDIVIPYVKDFLNRFFFLITVVVDWEKG